MEVLSSFSNVCKINIWNYTYIGFSQGNILFGILIAHSRERNLWVQEEEPATDMGEGLALALPLHMTWNRTRTKNVILVEYLNKATKKITKKTFEGSPDRNISQCQGMSNQEGPQRESLVQFSQCHS